QVDKVAPKLIVKAGKLDKRGTLTVKISCPAGEQSCTGTAKLVGKRNVALGSKSFTGAGGKTATVKFKLSKKQLAQVRKARKLAATVSVSAHDAAGNQSAAGAKVTLRVKR